MTRWDTHGYNTGYFLRKEVIYVYEGAILTAAEAMSVINAFSDCFQAMLVTDASTDICTEQTRLTSTQIIIYAVTHAWSWSRDNAGA